jgi:phosphohistidine phosphatase
MALLYVLRHAKSSWEDPALADHDRPLAPRGRRNAAVLAEQVARERIAPELILCSTALRARETLAALLAALDGECEIRLEDELYGATADQLVARLRELPEATSSALLLGHNPGLEDLVARLAGDEGPDRLPTAALVVLEGGAWASVGSSRWRVVSTTIPR